MRAARRPIVGADRVARFVCGLAHQLGAGASIDVRLVNAQPAAVLAVHGAVMAVVSCDVRAGAIHAIQMQVNPAKLTAVTAASPAPSRL